MPALAPKDSELRGECLSIQDYYRQCGDLSYEVDREHTDANLTRAEMQLLRGFLTGVSNSVHLCCGAGRHVTAFGELGISALGIDLSPYLVGKGHKEIQRDKLSHKVRLIIGNAEKAPIGSHTVDCVTVLGNSFSLLNLEEGKRLFAEMKRLLRPKGLVIVDIPVPKSALDCFVREQDKMCRTIQTERLGAIDVVWVRKVDERNQTVRSWETYTFSDANNGKQVRSIAFTFRLYEPDDLREMAREMGLRLATLLEYDDKSGRYLGMLRKRLFLVMTARG